LSKSNVTKNCCKPYIKRKGTIININLEIKNIIKWKGLTDTRRDKQLQIARESVEKRRNLKQEFTNLETLKRRNRSYNKILIEIENKRRKES
jgi:hypothetical protein